MKRVKRGALFCCPLADYSPQVISEATMTPCDTIKQKLQLNRYPSMASCVRETYREYGLVRGFYAGYTTALTMNAPYIAIQFATYESLKTMLAGEVSGEKRWGRGVEKEDGVVCLFFCFYISSHYFAFFFSFNYLIIFFYDYDCDSHS